MESKSGASTTSFTEISGLRTKEKRPGYLWESRASDQMSTQKVTVEPSAMEHFAIPLFRTLSLIISFHQKEPITVEA